MILKEIDRIEITTLQDNYIDVLAYDDTPIIQRAQPLRRVPDKGLELLASPQAEHGFSVLVDIFQGRETRALVFDFGCSKNGALFNADLLGIDLTRVETLALSHGHLDHCGGLSALAGRINKPGIDLVAHPAVFRPSRFVKTLEGQKIFFPPFSRDHVLEAGAVPVETADPRGLLGNRCLFLGEIPRNRPFEKGMPNTFFMDGGKECRDMIEDDTALCFHIRGKGLVIISGCAHSGIINTIDHAVKTTGINQVFAVMGGFHLCGPAFESQISPTLEALGEIRPRYIVPAHCTGRRAVMDLEKAMPENFILNMSGTRLRFTS